MIYTSIRQQQIATLITSNGAMQSSQIHSKLIDVADNISLVTIKRELSDMAKIGILKTEGSGRNTAYDLTTMGKLFLPVDSTPARYT